MLKTSPLWNGISVFLLKKNKGGFTRASSVEASDAREQTFKLILLNSKMCFCNFSTCTVAGSISDFIVILLRKVVLEKLYITPIQ
jgi:hypothetical protein